jgi:hypothetical protein
MSNTLKFYNIHVFILTATATPNVQTGSGAYPSSYSMVNGLPYQRINALGHEIDHCLPYSVEVKN